MTKQEIKDIMYQHKFNLEYRISGLEKLVEFNNIEEVEKEHEGNYPAQAGAFRAMVRHANDEVTRALKDFKKLNETVEEIILEGQKIPTLKKNKDGFD
jgi:arylsulfatase A-like enzyme